MIRLLLGLVLLFTTPATLAEPSVNSSVVFSSGEGGYYCFRIPALLFVGEETILAFAEGRGLHDKAAKCGDHGDVMIVYKKSTDCGVSWGPIVVVRDEYPHATSIGNPAPVFDAASGSVHLLFNRDNTKAFVMSSHDQGATWTDPFDITSTTSYIGQGFFGTGPPGGIQAKKGGFVVGAYQNESYVIVGDGSETGWKKQAHVGWAGTGEAQVAQLDDGRLVLWMRNSNGRRSIAWSSDLGVSWVNASDAAGAAFPSTACEGSILAVGGARLLASQPMATSRTHMGVIQSLDGGLSWLPYVALSTSPAAYSSLASNGRNIFCLYESGANSPYETLTLALWQL